MGIRVFELPFSQQLKGLHKTCLDIGFALSDGVNDGLVAELAWSDPLSVIVPARHPLLAHVQVKLQDALKFPLVLCPDRLRLSQPNPGGAGWSSRSTKVADT